METLPTTCRICESACGLFADVEGGRVVDLRPDPGHPVSLGFACRKGTTFHERMAAPDRITRPLLRGRPVGWEEALEAAGTGLAAIVDRYGSGSVGLYSGNAIGHGFGGVLGLEAFQRAFPGCRHYSCLTLDNSEQFAVAEWVFGHPLTTFVADYRGSDCIVLFGTDPLSSQPSQSQSHPYGPTDLRRNREALVVVDPRRSATAAASRVHLQPRVGTDVFVLAWLVRRALERGARCQSEPEHLQNAVDSFDLGRVVRVSGLSADALEALDAAIAGARRPLVWSGLGVLLGPHGTLGWWLTVCLQALTGGIGPGQPWFPGGSPGLKRAMAKVPLKGRDPERRSRIGDWPAMLGTFPAATLAADITTPGDRLRALVVVGGEPARSLPDARRATEALESLDLLVTVGVFGGPTADRSHVFLPAATWLERDESGLHNASQRPLAFGRRDRAVVPPAGEARPDWDILLDLCRASGRRPFASRVLDAALRWTGLTPEHVVGWGEHLLGGRGDTHAAVEPRLAVPELCAALVGLPDPAPGLRLLTTVRPPTAMNHWLRPRTEPVASVHPEDLAAAGLSEGRVVLEGPAGRLELDVIADPGLARGTVVVPFGGPVNPNAIIGTADLEPFSGQPWSNGTVVRLV